MESNSINLKEVITTFREQGYAKLENFLSEDRVARLNRAIDEVLAEEPDSYVYDVRHSVERHPEIAALIDDPSVLPIVVNLLGYNIQLHLSHLTEKRYNPNQQPAKNAGGWHQDGPVPTFPHVGGVTPLLYMKICYILSDLSEPNRGNTTVVPQSGNHPFNLQYKENGDVEGAVQICGKPGDAFIFAQNIWHSPSPNWSTLTRRQLFMGYAYLWMKPLDYHQVADHMFENASPERRQLLGKLDCDPFNYYVAANLQPELPLKAYVQEDLW